MRPHQGHYPMITGLILLLIGGVGLYGAWEDLPEKTKWWVIDGKTAVILGIVAFVGFLIFYYGTKGVLSNWYWWGMKR